MDNYLGTYYIACYVIKLYSGFCIWEGLAVLIDGGGGVVVMLYSSVRVNEYSSRLVSLCC